MPELPEVEVTKRALIPHLEGRTIEKLEIRETRLRWPIRVDLLKKIENEIVISLSRRGKYIFINTAPGTAMIHLGMSGSIGVLDQFVPPKKHDHFDIHLANKKIIRYNDPRRFGCFVWAGKQPEKHKLICHLGLEPLEKDFRGEYLYQLSKHRKTNIIAFIMNARVVVGVGNISILNMVWEQLNIIHINIISFMTQSCYFILVLFFKEKWTLLILHLKMDC